MEITEVRFKLVHGKNDKLRAFCSITIDNDFVIRDLKVIDGAKGPFVAMPSRKLMARCPECGGKNHFRAKYCNDCGIRLSPEKVKLDLERGPAEVEEGLAPDPDLGHEDSAEGEPEGATRSKFHAEIAHPINSKCREMIQRTVLEKYQEEMEKAEKSGYRPPAADLGSADDDDYFAADQEAGYEPVEAGPAAGLEPSSDPGSGPAPSRPAGRVEAGWSGGPQAADSGSSRSPQFSRPMGGGGEGGRHGKRDTSARPEAEHDRARTGGAGRGGEGPHRDGRKERQPAFDDHRVNPHWKGRRSSAPEGGAGSRPARPEKPEKYGVRGRPEGRPERPGRSERPEEAGRPRAEKSASGDAQRSPPRPAQSPSATGQGPEGLGGMEHGPRGVDKIDQPASPTVHKEEPEPEDNFGAGIF